MYAIRSYYEFFESEKNIAIIKRLKEVGLQFELQEQEKHSNKLEGLSIIASGKLTNFSRDEIKMVIEMNGGKAVSSISRNNFV